MLLVPDGEFAGQLLQAEITAGGIRRIALEKVNGAHQGAVFRFAQGSECGLNRMVFGPDGCLYVGGTGDHIRSPSTDSGSRRTEPSSSGSDVLLKRCNHGPRDRH